MYEYESLNPRGAQDKAVHLEKMMSDAAEEAKQKRKEVRNTKSEEDRKVKQFPADQKYKMDMENKSLHNQNDFMDALEQIGFFSIQP